MDGITTQTYSKTFLGPHFKIAINEFLYLYASQCDINFNLHFSNFNPPKVQNGNHVYEIDICVITIAFPQRFVGIFELDSCV